MCIFTSNEDINIDNSYKNIYPTINISVESVEECAKAIDISTSRTILEFIHNLPIEVLTYNGSFPQTSLNLGVIKIEDEILKIEISIRSSNVDEEKKYIDIVNELSKDMEFKLIDRKPFFSFKENSPLRDLLIKKYMELYNKDVQLHHVHAGLEGGVFKEHIKDIDICVIAPNLYDIHSVNERVEIQSVNRVYKWLIEVLKEL